MCPECDSVNERREACWQTCLPQEKKEEERSRAGEDPLNKKNVDALNRNTESPRNGGKRLGERHVNRKLWGPAAFGPRIE